LSVTVDSNVRKRLNSDNCFSLLMQDAPMERDASTLAAAASGGQLVILDYLYRDQNNNNRGRTELLTPIIPEAAVRNDQLPCLKLLHAWECEMGQTAYVAASYGHNDCLEFALGVLKEAK
jgi:hypothetical protein